jgi:hypothetical protein
MKYSILRKTISIITVCGHAQPHHNRPNAVVKMMMPVINTSMATAKITVSCGQKIWPRMEKRRSTRLSKRSGLPLMRIHCPANMMTMSAVANHALRRCHFPAGFFG